MTFSPVSQSDTVAHMEVFTALSIVEQLYFSHFHSAGNTCHIKSIFFAINLWAVGLKVCQKKVFKKT